MVVMRSPSTGRYEPPLTAHVLNMFNCMSPEPHPAASGILVKSLRAAAECEFDLVRKQPVAYQCCRDLARALVARLEGRLGQSPQDRLIRDKPFANRLLAAAGALGLPGAVALARALRPQALMDVSLSPYLMRPGVI
jgi:hypothetical protein